MIEAVTTEPGLPPSGNDPNAIALLQGIAARQESAMAAFYRHFQARVFRFAHTRVNDYFAAADILNEVMLEVWRVAGTYESRARVTTWLFSITHHKVVDYLRRNRRHVAEPLDFDLVDEAPAAQTEALISAASDRQALQEALLKLSAEHREILHLAFFEDMGYADIAQVIGVPEGTVKSRVFHARNQLKQALANTVVRP